MSKRKVKDGCEESYPQCNTVRVKYKTVVSSRSYLLSRQLYDVKTDFMCECMLKSYMACINTDICFLCRIYICIWIQQRGTGFCEKHCNNLTNVSQNWTMLAFLFSSISDQAFLSRERETNICSDFFFLGARFFGWRSDVFSIFQKVFSPAKLLSYFWLEFLCFPKRGGMCVLFLIFFLSHLQHHC